MYTDKEIAKLHADKNYKKTNSFCKNVHLSHTVIKAGISGIPVSISSEGKISSLVAVITLLWLFLRYMYITKEITSCRSRIIEGLLNTSFVIVPDKLVRDSIGAGNIWLEYKKDKIKVVKNACVEYIGTAEYRMILYAHSCIRDEAVFYQEFQKISGKIEQIFELANDELIQMKIKEAMLEYSNVLKDDECTNILINLFSNNQHTGNLTHGINSNNGNERG